MKGTKRLEDQSKKKKGGACLTLYTEFELSHIFPIRVFALTQRILFLSKIKYDLDDFAKQTKKKKRKNSLLFDKYEMLI